MLTKILPLIIGGLASVNALALPKVSFGINSRAAGDVSVKQLLEIAPTANTCDGAVKPDECRTAEQAAKYLVPGLAEYGIVDKYEIAAVLSLIAFESVDFKFNTNQSPGRPGQGTRSMMMIDSILEYAKSIKELKPKVLEIAPEGTSAESLNDEQKNKVRALVLPDEYSFASAAWFYKTKCDSVREAMKAPMPNAFALYGECVGYPPDPKREEKFALALKAFALPSPEGGASSNGTAPAAPAASAPAPAPAA